MNRTRTTDEISNRRDHFVLEGRSAVSRPNQPRAGHIPQTSNRPWMHCGEIPLRHAFDGQPAEVPRRMEAIDVQVGKRSNAGSSEAWSLTFILQDLNLMHAFAEICLAFAERIAEASSKDTALRQIYATVDQWQRLLKSSVMQTSSKSYAELSANWPRYSKSRNAPESVWRRFASLGQAPMRAAALHLPG